MSFNLGLNVVEVDGRVSPSIEPAQTSVAAFVIRAERGIPGEVVQVTNWSQFQEHFGSYTKDDNGVYYGAYAVRGFFDNGGAKAFVTRVVDVSTEEAAVDPLTNGASDMSDPESGWDVSGEEAEAGKAVVDSATVASADIPSDDNVTSCIIKITAGYRGKKDHGAWGNRLKVQIKNGTDDVAGHYDLVVYYNNNIVETWENLSIPTPSDDPEAKGLSVINNPYTGSKYINIEKQPEWIDESTTVLPKECTVKLTGGKNDKSPQATAFSHALSLFDVHEVQLVCCPESDDDAVVKDALTYCENRGDCMFLGHMPENHDCIAATGYGKGCQGKKLYGALYFPWIQVSDPIGDRIWIPPTGHIMGIYARTERERGIWKAPAGNSAQVRNALDVKHRITNADHTNLVKNGSVNAVRFVPGKGIIVDSSRTLSTNPIWYYVNVRLLFNFVKSSLMNGLTWVVQEPNDPTLWNKVKYGSVVPFLNGLWRRGAFGPGSPDEVFTVKIDAENNTPADIQQGRLNVEVYFYPSRPAETIVIIVGQQEGGASASEG